MLPWLATVRCNHSGGLNALTLQSAVTDRSLTRSGGRSPLVLTEVRVRSSGPEHVSARSAGLEGA